MTAAVVSPGYHPGDLGLVAGSLAVSSHVLCPSCSSCVRCDPTHECTAPSGHELLPCVLCTAPRMQALYRCITGVYKPVCPPCGGPFARLRGFSPCRECGAARGPGNAPRARRPGDQNVVALCNNCFAALVESRKRDFVLAGLHVGSEVMWGPRRVLLLDEPSPRRRRILVQVLPDGRNVPGYERLVAVRELRLLTPVTTSCTEASAQAAPETNAAPAAGEDHDDAGRDEPGVRAWA